MAKKLYFNLELPGKGSGTLDDPCEAGALRFHFLPQADGGPLYRPGINVNLDSSNWLQCPDPTLGPRWQWFGREGDGMKPFLILPISHNKKETPCSLHIQAFKEINGVIHRAEKTIWYYTPSCPLHRTNDEKEELEKEMWLTRQKEVGRGLPTQYKTIILLEEPPESARVHPHSIMFLIMYELEPERFTRGMMRTTFKGNVYEYTILYNRARLLLRDKVAWARGENEETEPEPVPEPVPTPTPQPAPVPDPNEDDQPSIGELLDGISELVTVAEQAIAGIKAKVENLSGR